MDAIWKKIKTVIKNRIPEHSYKMWIEPVECKEIQENNLTLVCPNFFFKKRVQNYYGALIELEANKILGKVCEIKIEVSNKKHSSKQQSSIRQMSLPDIAMNQRSKLFLRKDFTFDKFVVSGNNDFAYSASLSLASQTKNGRNILFLLSKTGMGKSHLSQAIGHHISSKYPSERIYYITAEDFMSEMIYAFRHNSIDNFKKKYRKECDVLLIEDVHYLSGKERTQIELAFIFDTLFEANKKIIFSSCYLPSEIPKLNDQLKSRLSCGLVSNIEPPIFRTRVRILKKKASQNENAIPEEVIHYLASEITGDIRQLESGLTGIVAKSSLLEAPIDLKLAESVVKNIVKQRKNITINVIKKLVCKNYNVSIDELVSRSRKQNIVHPRQIAIYLSRKYTDSPLQTIGKSFNRYHATALHSIASIERKLKENSNIHKHVEFLIGKLESEDF